MKLQLISTDKLGHVAKHTFRTEQHPTHGEVLISNNGAMHKLAGSKLFRIEKGGHLILWRTKVTIKHRG